jgi:phosphatidylinositol alpha-mannosyltransferase
MRICLVCPYDLAQEGGVKRHCVHLAAALRSGGDDVDVVGPCADGHALPDGMYGLSGVVNVPNNGSDNWIGAFAGPAKLRRLFRARRYDVVHVHEPLVPALGYWALFHADRAARVGTFHAFAETEGFASRATRKLVGAVAMGALDRGIAVSPAAARFARVAFSKPLAVIPNGIRCSIFANRPEPSPDAALRLLFVGHWRDPRKGLAHLLDACTQLRIRWTLDVVGDGGTLPRRQLAGVRYHGPVASESALAELYAACDVFVAPSTGMESFGIVLLEAMATGRAIVCSDIEGYRGAVGDAGALCVPPGSPDALAAAITELADPDKRAAFAARNRARASEFEWDALAARVRLEYVAAVAGRP